MAATSQPVPGGRPERRELTVKAWLSGAAVLGLVVVAGFAAAAGFVLFTVALIVLAVFGVVELTWSLRRRR